MGDHDSEPKVPDLPPRPFSGNLDSKGSYLPSKTVLTFASYGMGFGGLSLLVWVLYQLIICGCA